VSARSLSRKVPSTTIFPLRVLNVPEDLQISKANNNINGSSQEEEPKSGSVRCQSPLSPVIVSSTSLSWAVSVSKVADQGVQTKKGGVVTGKNAFYVRYLPVCQTELQIIPNTYIQP
jgi:hypothetical protein